jgi:glycosyltransferase involved in cell wall biosynthesis
MSKNRTKVLWITNTLGYGGAQKQVLNMYDILRESPDFDITVLYYARMKEEMTFDDVNVVFIDKDKMGKLTFITEIAKYVKKHGIIIIHAFGGGSANIYGRAAAAMVKDTIPVGAMLGKKHFKSFNYKILNSGLNLFGNWWTVNNLELIPILKHDLKFIDDKKIALLHNGFVPADKVDYCKNEITDYDRDKGNNFVFTVIGRLQPVKNYPLFLRAAREVTKINSNVRFWIIGDGDERLRLEKLAEEYGINDYVRFWGFRDDIDAALERTDVFIQTSTTEGSPNTIAEAMRASKPIISTNSTDLSEMIENGKNGFIIENGNVGELIDSMEHIMSLSKNQIAEYGKYSYKLFEEFFLDKKVASEFKKFYKTVLEGVR